MLLSVLTPFEVLAYTPPQYMFDLDKDDNKLHTQKELEDARDPFAREFDKKITDALVVYRDENGRPIPLDLSLEFIGELEKKGFFQQFNIPRALHVLTGISNSNKFSNEIITVTTNATVEFFDHAVVPSMQVDKYKDGKYLKKIGEEIWTRQLKMITYFQDLANKKLNWKSKGNWDKLNFLDDWYEWHPEFKKYYCEDEWTNYEYDLLMRYYNKRQEIKALRSDLVTKAEYLPEYLTRTLLAQAALKLGTPLLGLARYYAIDKASTGNSDWLTSPIIGKLQNLKPEQMLFSIRNGFDPYGRPLDPNDLYVYKIIGGKQTLIYYGRSTSTLPVVSIDVGGRNLGPISLPIDNTKPFVNPESMALVHKPQSNPVGLNNTSMSPDKLSQALTQQAGNISNDKLLTASAQSVIDSPAMVVPVEHSKPFFHKVDLGDKSFLLDHKKMFKNSNLPFNQSLDTAEDIINTTKSMDNFFKNFFKNDPEMYKKVNDLLANGLNKTFVIKMKTTGSCGAYEICLNEKIYSIKDRFGGLGLDGIKITFVVSKDGKKMVIHPLVHEYMHRLTGYGEGGEGYIGLFDLPEGSNIRKLAEGLVEYNSITVTQKITGTNFITDLDSDFGYYPYEQVFWKKIDEVIQIKTQPILHKKGWSVAQSLVLSKNISRNILLEYYIRDPKNVLYNFFGPDFYELLDRIDSDMLSNAHFNPNVKIPEIDEAVKKCSEIFDNWQKNNPYYPEYFNK